MIPRHALAPLLAALLLAGAADLCIARALPGDSDDELTAFLGITGSRERAADSCVRVLSHVTKEPPASRFTDDDDGWHEVQCARWLGTLGGPKALPTLERIIALKRTAQRDGKVGSFMRQVQEKAFRSRVQLMLANGDRNKVATELIAAYERGRGAGVHTEHEIDLEEFSEFILAERDEFIDDLVQYARTHLIPIPKLPAKNEEAYGKYAAVAHFAMMLSGSTPARRGAMIGLLTDKSADARELGVHLVDLSPKTIDTLLTMHAAATTETRPAIRAALTTLRGAVAQIIPGRERDLAHQTKDSPRWNLVKSDLDQARAQLGRIDAALR